MATDLAGEPLPPQPTFQGRLNLTNFAFKSEPTTPVRRSPRHATPLATPRSGASPSPSPSKTLKRPSSTPAEDAASTPDSPATKKRKKQKSAYAPPSKYAHLAHLSDAIAPNLIVLSVGLNPGIQTAATGHAYAHPSNLFWKLQHSSGITTVRCRPDEDRTMPERFALGLTNIVSRPTRNNAELLNSELDEGVEVLERKARRWRPEAVCLVGKSIWESVWRVRHGRSLTKADFSYGWQPESENMGVLEAGDDPNDVEDGVRVDEGWKGARIFVAPSTSGLAATLPRAEKETIWRELGAWVEKRREERGG